MLDDEIMYYNNDPNRLNLLVLCFLHSKTNNTQYTDDILSSIDYYMHFGQI